MEQLDLELLYCFEKAARDQKFSPLKIFLRLLLADLLETGKNNTTTLLYAVWGARAGLQVEWVGAVDEAWLGLSGNRSNSKNLLSH